MNTNYLQEGYILHQRYTIEKVLGQGGFGITYLAIDEKLHQKVCVKELFISGNSTRGENHTVVSFSTQEFSFSEFVSKFMQEARQLAPFRHEGIVRVQDIFEENNTAYMVMEFVEGKTLKTLIQEKGNFSQKEASPIMEQMLNAVEAVHEKGILHRDIKPENILMNSEGKTILIDFGSARQFAEGLTLTQTAMLTPGYAPLEQYSNRAKRGPYTDIYALGATFYHLTTGAKPLPATDRNLENLPSPSELKASVSQPVSNAIMKAMELKPENRFQTVAEFRNALFDKTIIVQTSQAIDSNKTQVFEKQNDTNTSKPIDVNKQKMVLLWLLVLALVAIPLILFFPKEIKNTDPIVANLVEGEMPVEDMTSDTLTHAIDLNDAIDEDDRDAKRDNKTVVPTIPSENASNKNEEMLLGKRTYGSHFFTKYGKANFEKQEGKITLYASQSQGKNYCILQGEVEIIDDRTFKVTGMLDFYFFDDFCEDEVTLRQTFTFKRSGSRKYWRLQMPDTQTGYFQKCNHYIDIFM